MENAPNPFEWMPSPGKSVKIPGGVLWCEGWKVNRDSVGLASGSIIFGFEMSETEYDRATQCPKKITSANLIEDSNAEADATRPL
jgi:hypothetical protein